jgi:hypothetical protein
VRPVDPPPVGAVGRVAVVLAGLSLLGYLVAAVVLIVPVETPEVQDCGAPGAYLLAGRLDVFPDENGQIPGADGQLVTLDPEVAEEARATPCRERVAARAVPSAILLTGATLLGLVAFGIELFVVRPRQRRAIRADMAASPGEPEAPTA